MFPKFQISKFMNGGRDLQIVFRTNSEDEYLEQLAKWQEVSKPKVEVLNDKCKDCGAVLVTGRNGKPYCKACYIAWKEKQKANEL